LTHSIYEVYNSISTGIHSLNTCGKTKPLATNESVILRVNSKAWSICYFLLKPNAICAKIKKHITCFSALLEGFEFLGVPSLRNSTTKVAWHGTTIATSINFYFYFILRLNFLFIFIKKEYLTMFFFCCRGNSTGKGPKRPHFSSNDCTIIGFVLIALAHFSSKVATQISSHIRLKHLIATFSCSPTFEKWPWINTFMTQNHHNFSKATNEIWGVILEAINDS